MATQFKNKVVKEIGTVPILGLETNAGTQSTVVGLSLANLTEGIIYSSILLHDDTSIEGFFLKDVPIPPNSSLRALDAGEKLILSPNNQLFFVCDQDEGLDVIISYVDIV
jgi:hypothetical protein